MIGKTFERKKINSHTGIMQCGRSEKETKTFRERPHMFQKGPICFRKVPYVSERTYMFQRNPICLKKRPICGPYVVLSEGFSSPYVEKAPYVANQVPICGPYAAHMWPICFGCSSAQKNAAQTPSDCGVGPEKKLFPSLQRQPARELCVAEAWFTTAFFFRMIQLSSSSARRDHSCDR